MPTRIAIAAGIASVFTAFNGFAQASVTQDLATRRKPYRVVILCDASKSGGGVGLTSFGPVNRVRAELIRAIVPHLREGSSVRVASFGDRYLLSPRWVSTFDALWQAFESVHQPSGDRSPVWDAIHSSAAVFEDTPDRRVIFLVSDGKASGNVHGFDAALDRVREQTVAVYVAGAVGRPGRSLQADRPDHPAARLKRMAEATAGEYAEPVTRSLPGFFGNVLRRLNASRVEFFADSRPDVRF